MAHRVCRGEMVLMVEDESSWYNTFFSTIFWINEVILNPLKK